MKEIITHPAEEKDLPLSSKMKYQTGVILRRPADLLILWVALLFLALLLSIFLHEVGHGLGARIEGIHVSTGFNQVGDYGKSPDDPDFRSQSGMVSVLGGLVGPFTTWTLAIIFTLWLYRFKELSCRLWQLLLWPS